ncbi:hypothetical protein KGM_213466 [Danaus plexippus plexippus]|uniref:Uncharacterized protein n=1 Tax=Danaus plexippus plexippus TaxID=278856 RepID=A0A212ELS3_DANPL|nr:hypothetical protein KGM_213466 [Danaus plexippus plexippus]
MGFARGGARSLRPQLKPFSLQSFSDKPAGWSLPPVSANRRGRFFFIYISNTIYSIYNVCVTVICLPYCTMNVYMQCHRETRPLEWKSKITIIKKDPFSSVSVDINPRETNGSAASAARDLAAGSSIRKVFKINVLCSVVSAASVVSGARAVPPRRNAKTHAQNGIENIKYDIGGK